MPIYTYESPHSLPRLANKFVIVDTSYLQDLSDPNEENFETILEFHRQALANNTTFSLNVVVRQEFIKLVRKTLLINAIMDLSRTDPVMETRYRTVTGFTSKPFTPENLKNAYEQIYKNHLKKNDFNLLLDAMKTDIWQEVQMLEDKANITYVSAPSKGADTWEALGELVQKTGMTPTDAMIVNFAFMIDADAIVTTDCDYAPVEESIDVYMPLSIAQQCGTYDPSLD